MKHHSNHLLDQHEVHRSPLLFEKAIPRGEVEHNETKRAGQAIFAFTQPQNASVTANSGHLIGVPCLPENQKAPNEAYLGEDYAAKRFVDIAGSLALLIFFGPLMVVIALILLCFQRGPVLYRQERIGRHGKLFRIIKFRTMTMTADQTLEAVLTVDRTMSNEWQERQKLSHDPRVTTIGRFLRISSIDELPQLFNVLKGEMSLVGPRPIVAGEAARYGRFFANYCSARPGLTGLWQVSGRNEVTYTRRVAMDVCYTRDRSLARDLLILLKTVPAVLTARGR